MSAVYVAKTKYIYPKEFDDHMIKRSVKCTPILDDKYEYYGDGTIFKLKRFFLRILLKVIAIPYVRIRFCLNVEGRSNLRKNKALLKNGFVTTCNHVSYYDYLMVLSAVRKWGRFPIWKVNMQTGGRGLFKMAGGITVPDTIQGLKVFSKSLDYAIKKDKWLHVYPEGSMWYYYSAIRPYKKGTFSIAYRNNTPVIPLAITFKEPKGLYRLFKKDPCATIKIGKPIMADYSLEKHAGVKKLNDDVFEATVKLAGYDSNQQNAEMIQNYIKNNKICENGSILY